MECDRMRAYHFDESAFKKCRVLRFEVYSETWLDFVLRCRRGEDVSDYDIVMGGVANDKVSQKVIDKYLIFERSEQL